MERTQDKKWKAAISPKDCSSDKNKLTMDNYKSNENKFQFKSRAETLQLSKLSGLPERKPLNQNGATTSNAYQLVAVAVCAGCGVRLDLDDAMQRTFCGCRKCAAIYSRIILAMESKNEKQQKFILSKMAGGKI